jgi:Glycosyl hydrolase family 9./N-terminal ig-like domain of cellulase.
VLPSESFVLQRRVSSRTRLFLASIGLGAALAAAPASHPYFGVSVTPVRLSSVGFLPDVPKRATIAGATIEEVEVRDARDRRVDVAVRLQPVQNPDTAEDQLTVADFDDLPPGGPYTLLARIDGAWRRSARFVVSAGAVNEPLRVVARAMSQTRCGCAVDFTYSGKHYAHEPCHVNGEDGWLDYVETGKVPEEPRLFREASGGWHDAGDYNKYVTTGSFAAAMMLQAWCHHRETLQKMNLELGDPALPDLLEEVRWEIEWLLKMQRDDGAVYHKLTTNGFGSHSNQRVLPENDRRARFFTPPTTAATANFTAVCALAARVFGGLDEDDEGPDDTLADRCRSAAALSWRWLLAHPENRMPSAEDVLGTGPYINRGGQAQRLWAAIELYRESGDTRYLEYFESDERFGVWDAARVRLRLAFSHAGPSWENIIDLALGGYLEADGPRTPEIVGAVRHELADRAARMVSNAETHGYGRAWGSNYSWGGNARAAAQSYLLQIAKAVWPEKAETFRATQFHIVANLFGRNYHGRSYVTGLGFCPPELIHDRRRDRSADPRREVPDPERPERMLDIAANLPPWHPDMQALRPEQRAWPGLLVGHAMPLSTDDDPRTFEIRNDGRAWVDKDNSAMNENSLHSNSCLIYALSAFATF